MDFKEEDGVGYWRVRGADTWNPFKSGNSNNGINSYDLVYGGEWIDTANKNFSYTPYISGNYLVVIACGGGNTGATATMSGQYDIINSIKSIQPYNYGNNTTPALVYIYILKLTEWKNINILTTADGTCHSVYTAIYKIDGGKETFKAPKPLVPKLTSNIGSDGGEASCYKLNSNGGDAYLAFDGNLSYVDTHYGTGGYASDVYFQYKFSSPVIVKQVVYNEVMLNRCASLHTAAIQYSDNGTSWTTLTTADVSNCGSEIDVYIDAENVSNVSAKYWRFQCLTSDTGGVVYFRNIQFYGYKSLNDIPSTDEPEYGDFSSMVSLIGGYNGASAKYICLKDTTALITMWGKAYTANNYISINGINIFSHTGTSFFNDFKFVDLKAGDIITVFANTGSSNYGNIACIYHNGGLY